MPHVKTFRVEPPINNIRNIILRLHHGLPRGLVVRIRRSHAAARVQSTVGELYHFLKSLFLSVERFHQSPRLCGNV